MSNDIYRSQAYTISNTVRNDIEANKIHNRVISEELLFVFMGLKTEQTRNVNESYKDLGHVINVINLERLGDDTFDPDKYMEIHTNAFTIAKHLANRLINKRLLRGEYDPMQFMLWLSYTVNVETLELINKLSVNK